MATNASSNLMNTMKVTKLSVLMQKWLRQLQIFLNGTEIRTWILILLSMPSSPKADIGVAGMTVSEDRLLSNDLQTHIQQPLR